jgi:16S rRNA (guanine527-N7)-methyltransferase
MLAASNGEPMARSPSDDVQRVVSALPAQRGFELNRDQLAGYVEELLTWNPSLGLVSRRDTPAVVAHLILKSLEMWEFVVNHRSSPWTVVDIGSGAGFPGLIWKLAVPTLDVTLVERKNRRALFLDRVARRLALDRVAVLATDLDDLVRRSTHNEVFDLATAIAVAPPEKLGPAVERLLKPGGGLAAVRSPDEPIAATVGEHLHLQAQAAASTGIFLLYEKR